ncbi:MAG: inositol monophosphatase [Alphaproteobacteria bacterium]
MNIKNDDIINILQEASQKIIMPLFGKLQNDDIKTKTNPNDFVTTADLLSEKFLSSELLKIIPNSLVFGEESAFQEQTSKEVFKSDNPIWIIDPVDGTRNFVNQNPNFGIILSLVIKQEAVLGYIFKPTTGEYIIAEKGSGCIDEKQEAISLPTPKGATPTLNGIVGTITEKIAATVPDVNWFGSAAGAYLDFLKQKTDFLIFKPQTLHSWDHIAGILACHTIGAEAKLANGNEYTVADSKGCLICATNKETWQDLQQLAL